MRTPAFLAAASVLALVMTAASQAQVGAGPQREVLPATIPAPRDHPYAGSIELGVDARDTAHGIFSAHEELPVQASGDTVLLYPEWETASHAPTALATALAGLVVHIDGRRVEWRRDPIDMHAFHVAVPMGARRLALDFQYIPERRWLRPDLIEVFWHPLLLYPAGWFTRDIPVSASLRLPPGLHPFTSLTTAGGGGDEIRYRPVTLEQLADAPVMAGRFSRQVDLAPGAPNPVWLDLLAERADDAVIDAAQLGRLRNMVAQAAKVFGPPPFRHYDAIAVLTDALPDGGVEHLEDGENDLPASFFRYPAKHLDDQDLIAHEYVHAWNGRFRQPADLWTATWNEPARGSLLWVYEGQTEFWGRVLAARAGLRSRQQTLDKLAIDADFVASRQGRAWKTLADSTNDPIYMALRPSSWTDWKRKQDYYPEGVLLWLDVEARLRELTGGRKGLDDFARGFFGTAGGQPGVTTTYRFADVVAALQALAADDWAGFLAAHLHTHDAHDALAGLDRAGWRLVYTDTPTEAFRQLEAANGVTDLSASIGLQVDEAGRISDVAWAGPAFRAGLAPGARITAVNGKPWTPAALVGAVAHAAGTPVVLRVSGGADDEVTIAYSGTLRFPHLEPIPGATDRLSGLLKAR